MNIDVALMILVTVSEIFPMAGIFIEFGLLKNTEKYSHRSNMKKIIFILLVITKISYSQNQYIGLEISANPVKNVYTDLVTHISAFYDFSLLQNSLLLGISFRIYDYSIKKDAIEFPYNLIGRGYGAGININYFLFKDELETNLISPYLVSRILYYSNSARPASPVMGEIYQINNKITPALGLGLILWPYYSENINLNLLYEFRFSRVEYHQINKSADLSNLFINLGFRFKL